MLTSVYVDSLNGDDLNSGKIDGPLETISEAISRSYEGSEILVAGGSYGNISVSNKRLKITALKDSDPSFGSITILNGQAEISGVEITGGLTLENSVNLSGSLTLRGCLLTGTSFIKCTKVKYISIFRNRIETDTLGVDIKDSLEVGIGSNTFIGTDTPVKIQSVKRLDFFNNSVNTAQNIQLDGVAAPTSYHTTYIEATDDIISASKVTLPVGVIDQVAVSLPYGPAQGQGIDFVVYGNTIDWTGTEIEENILVGDILRVIYTATPEGSETRWRFDSNNLTNIVNGIQTATGADVQYRNNNFWQTPPPVVFSNGNISADPLYQDPLDPRLSSGSPDRDAAYESRWLDTFNSVVPYDRYKDMIGAHRKYVQDGLPADIGSYEYLSGTNEHHASGLFFGAQGFDLVYGGNESDPVLKLSRAFEVSENLPIKVVLPDPQQSISSRHNTVVESAIDTDFTSSVSVQNPQENDIPFVEKVDQISIRSWNPSYSPGSSVYISEQGDDLSGDGTQANPYRTIDKGLSTSADNILVEAGTYPTFTGVPGKRVIPIQKIIEMGSGGFSTSSTEYQLWSTNSSANSDVKFFSSKINFNHQ